MTDNSLAPSLIAAGSGLLGALIGGAVTFLAQWIQRTAEQDAARRATAAAIGAEIDAYMNLMTRRNHMIVAQTVVDRLQRGENIALKGLFSSTRSTPAEMFPVAFSQIDRLGLLGGLVFDLNRFYSLLGGVTATVDEANAGRFDSLDAKERSSLIHNEMVIWDEALNLGKKLAPRLKEMAGV